MSMQRWLKRLALNLLDYKQRTGTKYWCVYAEETQSEQYVLNSYTTHAKKGPTQLPTRWTYSDAETSEQLVRESVFDVWANNTEEAYCLTI